MCEVWYGTKVSPTCVWGGHKMTFAIFSINGGKFEFSGGCVKPFSQTTVESPLFCGSE